MSPTRPARLSLVSLLIGLAGFMPACATSSATAPGPASAAGGDAFPGAGAPKAIPSTVAFESLEGPLWLTAQNALVFSDVVESNGPNAKIYRFDPARGTVNPLPYPPPTPVSTNGLAADPIGRLVACERYNARIVRVESDGTGTVLADHWPLSGGKPLSAPNDLTIRADGNIYFTDNDWGTRQGIDHAATGVYRIAPEGTLSRLLDLEKPNGIALSPDGSKLYIGSDALAKIWVMPLDAAGLPSAPTLLIDGATVPGGFKVPDGICVDDTGNLYVANNDDAIKAVLAFDPAGHPLGRIAIPFRPSNCTFGGADRRSMYVTTLHAVYEVRMPTPGIP